MEKENPQQVCQKMKKGSRVFSKTADATAPPAWALVEARAQTVCYAVLHTCLRNQHAITQAVELLTGWIETRTVVRVIGAGRSLLAATMPGNRLAHAGVQVSFLGGMIPLPNSTKGGGIIACSASGRTQAVLEAMRTAKQNNPQIQTLGLAYYRAQQFAELCDVFVGIHTPKTEYPNPLSALADTEEYVIGEILEGLVVKAGQNAGFDDQAWRRGHEDIGPTGPYAP